MIDELSAGDHIRNLLYTYADRLDRADRDALEDLFAHAVVTSEAAEGEWRGRAVATPRDPSTPELSLFRAADLDGHPGTHHVTTNSIIELDESGTSARARSYYTVFQARNDLPFQAVVGGRYDDTFELVEGRWRFSSRRFHVDHVGDLSELLGKDPRT